MLKGKTTGGEASDNGNGNQNTDRNRFKKVEMPTFAGLELESWIFRAERYYEIQKLSEDEKMIVAIISFDGIAMAWYRYTDNREKFRDWNDLKGRLQDQFHPMKEGRQCAQLLSIKQEGTFAKYCQTFEAWAVAVPQLSDKVLESAFLNGLDPVMRAEFRALEPKGLDQVVRKAQLIDDINTASLQAEGQNVTEKAHSGPTTGKTVSKTLEVIPTRTVTLSSKVPLSMQVVGTSHATKKETPFKKFTEAEFHKRKERGLCFRCEEEYTVGH